MPVRKILAREFTLEVEDDGDWLTIGGVKTISLGGSKTDAVTTDFDSEGFAEHFVAERGATVGFQGHYLEDPATGDRDEGQERIDALALLVGPDSLGSFRITSPGGLVRSFEASVVVEGPGGGTNDPAAWNVTLTCSGNPGAFAAGS